jgi:hypothetical protein
MDGDERRHIAMILTIALVILLTGLLMWGVLHKINQRILKPAEGIKSVPATQKAN